MSEREGLPLDDHPQVTRRALFLLGLGAVLYGLVVGSVIWRHELRGQVGVGPNIAQPPVVVRLPRRVGLR